MLVTDRCQTNAVAVQNNTPTQINVSQRDSISKPWQPVCMRTQHNAHQTIISSVIVKRNLHVELWTIKADTNYELSNDDCCCRNVQMRYE